MKNRALYHTIPTLYRTRVDQAATSVCRGRVKCNLIETRVPTRRFQVNRAPGLEIESKKKHKSKEN